MIKLNLVVTRHPGLLEYLKEVGLATSETACISHVTSPDMVRGKHVCGVLPHSLSCLCKSFTEIPLDLPQELRGKELTLEDMRKYASAPVTYRVTVVTPILPSVEKLPPDKEFLKTIANREYDNHVAGERPLIEVAASHDHALMPDECEVAGVNPDTPCRKLTGGYNGKRPIYIMEGKKGLVMAEGTYMGNHSYFSLGKPGEVRRVPRSIEEETRLNFLEKV